jgi:hypothetical protein
VATFISRDIYLWLRAVCAPTASESARSHKILASGLITGRLGGVAPTGMAKVSGVPPSCQRAIADELNRLGSPPCVVDSASNRRARQRASSAGRWPSGAGGDLAKVLLAVSRLAVHSPGQMCRGDALRAKIPFDPPLGGDARMPRVVVVARHRDTPRMAGTAAPSMQASQGAVSASIDSQRGADLRRSKPAHFVVSCPSCDPEARGDRMNVERCIEK